jgi:D-sedoheptulose 7-phosphate isomerase
VMSLADSGPAVTALGNDVCFEEIFAEQLRAWMRPGDLLIVMSCSGNSPNVLRAVEQARQCGGKTAGVVGFDGGKLRDLVDLPIHIESGCDEYGPVEDAFSVVMHAVCGYIIMSRGRMMRH